MGLKEDFENDFSTYLTVDGYSTNEPIAPGTVMGCTNHTMYTSEMYIMKHKLGIDSQLDRDKWEQLIDNCMLVPGLSLRFPKFMDLDSPDNIYGILAASKVLNKPQVAYSMLQYGMSNYGFYNVFNPNHIKNQDGSINWGALQWRQIQEIFAMHCASGNYKIWKFWLWPLEIYAGLVIATSCIGVETSNTDARRLSWLLIQAVKEDSLFCRLMSKIWYKRLYKDYGPTGMKAVAGIYYKPEINNPYAKYWID